MAETAVLGKIVKTVGLKGEVKLLPGPDFWPEALAADSLNVVLDDAVQRTVHVSSSRTKGETFILRLAGIDTVDVAQGLVGTNLEISLNALGAVPLPHAALPCQLIGLDVVLADGSMFGVVVDMLLGPAQNCLIVERDGERYLVPHAPGLVRRLSIDEGVIEIDPPEGLLDLKW
jgi:16S rRNA processing protein RimM